MPHMSVMEEAATKKVLDYPFAAKYCIAINNYKARTLVLHTTNSSSSIVASLPIVSQVFFSFGCCILQAGIASF
jgi:hypothetical protein